MVITRRAFLKLVGGTIGGLIVWTTRGAALGTPRKPHRTPTPTLPPLPTLTPAIVVSTAARYTAQLGYRSNIGYQG